MCLICIHIGGVRFEGKMIMRPEAVEMYFIHYLTQIKHPYHTAPIHIDAKTAVIFHSRTLPSNNNSSIYGRRLPLFSMNYTTFVCTRPFYLKIFENQVFPPGVNEVVKEGVQKGLRVGANDASQVYDIVNVNYTFSLLFEQRLREGYIGRIRKRATTTTTTTLV